MASHQVLDAQRDRIYWIDRLKALSIILVLVRHLRPFSVSRQGQGITHILIFVQDLIYTQLTTLAVPVFFIISLYIFFGKRTTKKDYTIQRIVKLIGIFIFWVGVQTVAWLLTLLYFRTVKSYDYPWPDISFLDFIVHGGPPLPIIGQSVFYFLFVLICLTLLAEMFYRLPRKIASIISVVIVVYSLLLFEYIQLNNLVISYWNIENFVLYIPLAYWLHARLEKIAARKHWIITGFLLFIIHDLVIVSKGLLLSPYGRVTTVLGAIWLFCSFAQSQNRASQFVSFLGAKSLGIYALHSYWLLIGIFIF